MSQFHNRTVRSTIPGYFNMVSISAVMAMLLNEQLFRNLLSMKPVFSFEDN